MRHIESDLAVRNNIIEKLTVQCDNNEQYSRRIHGIEVSGKEDNPAVLEKVKKCYDEVDVVFDVAQIDRAHRIGAPFTNKEGKKVQSIIVKYKSWSDRAKLYNNRPRGKKGLKKPSLATFTVTVDLTKRRYNLLKYAKEISKDNSKVHFSFVDINCSLGVKLMNNSFRCFDTKEQLDKIINT